MAPKSKQSKNYCMKSLLVSIPVVITVVYILRKCYNILMYENSRGKVEEGTWWILSLFSSEDTRTSKDLSLLQLLYSAVAEDVFILLSIVKEICFTCYGLLTVIFQNLVLTVISVCIIVISVYYLLIKSCDPKQKRTNERESKVIKSCKINASTLNDSNLDHSALNVYHLNRKYWSCLLGLMFLAFLLSIPWEFIRLYQSMVAEKVTHMAVGIPAECVPEQMSIIQSVKSWLRLHFSWRADPCLVYHKALLIDPLWQVSPSMVISSAFSHCIIYPVEVLLGGLGRALRAFFAEIPAPWQPFMFVIIVVFLLLAMVMVFGYRIHFPFILKIEPKTPVNQRSVPRTSEQLQKEKRQKSIEPSQQTELIHKN